MRTYSPCKAAGVVFTPVSFLVVETFAVFCFFIPSSVSVSVSPAVSYHSPGEPTTEPSVSLSFVAGVMKL